MAGFPGRTQLIYFQTIIIKLIYLLKNIKYKLNMQLILRSIDSKNKQDAEGKNKYWDNEEVVRQSC